MSIRRVGKGPFDTIATLGFNKAILTAPLRAVPKS